MDDVYAKYIAYNSLSWTIMSHTYRRKEQKLVSCFIYFIILRNFDDDIRHMLLFLLIIENLMHYLMKNEIYPRDFFVV